MNNIINLKNLLNSKISQNIIWLFSERTIQIVLGIVITGLYARSLGTDGFGIYQYASSIISVVLSFTAICGNDVLVPILVNQKEEFRIHTLYNIFLIRIVASFSIYILFLIFLIFSNYEHDLFLLCVLWGLIIIMSEPFGVIRGWLEAKTFIKPNSIIRIVSLIIKFILTYLFFLLKWKIYWIGFIMFIDILITSVLQFIYFKKNFSFTIVLKRNWRLIKSLLIMGFMFWVSLIFFFIFSKLDKILLKNYVSFYDLGIYTSATTITDYFNTIIPIISSSFAPILIYRETNLKKLKKNIYLILAILISISIIGSTLLYFLAAPIINLLFGSLFTDAQHILKISVWVSVFVFIESGLNLVLLKMRAFKIIIFKWLAALLINFIVIIISVNYLHIYAGILGIFSGYFVVALISLTVVLRKINLKDNK